MTYEISTSDSAGTQAVAELLASHLQGGEVIQLISDLGGGKTTFTQGLARGLGYSGDVTSPTFTISRIYKLDGALELHHYDLYRIGQDGPLGQEIIEDVADPKVITVIEWARLVENKLPADRLRVIFEVTSENGRSLKLESGGPISNQLVKAVMK